MKTYSLKGIFARTLVVAFFAIAALSATAAPPAPNLEVLAWQGNSSPLVESPYQYTSRVKNVGNRNAAGVMMTVEFPLTATSPTRYVLGKLTSVQANGGGACSVVSNKIVCNFGTIASNQIRSVTFTFEFQVATTAPALRSTVTTASTNENTPANNSLSFTPVLTYPDNIVSAGTFLVSSCSGQGLTSYYDCEMSPGSVQSGLSLDLNLGGTLLVNGYPNYFGFWDQIVLPNKSLHFTIDGGTGTEVEFNGFATSQACFEGIANFPQNSNYNAAYRVCRQ